MRWTAVVPLKSGLERKTRLSPVLDREARALLTERMAARVLGALDLCEAIAEIRLLSPARPPKSLPVLWEPDLGHGLNAELDRLRLTIGPVPVLVIHADLPLIGPGDIAELTGLAEAHGAAIAPDRRDEGTNAVAVLPATPLAFSFGIGSLARHRAALAGAAVVRRPGLMVDVDTPDDLAEARRLGADI